MSRRAAVSLAAAMLVLAGVAGIATAQSIPSSDDVTGSISVTGSQNDFSIEWSVSPVETADDGSMTLRIVALDPNVPVNPTSGAILSGNPGIQVTAPASGSIPYEPGGVGASIEWDVYLFERSAGEDWQLVAGPATFTQQGGGISWSDISGIPNWLSGAKDFLSNPIESVKKTVSSWAFNLIFAPIVDGVIWFVTGVIDSLLFVAFGADRSLPAFGAETVDVGEVGLVDIPLYIAGQFTIALAPVGAAILAPIQAINGAIANAADQAGLAAPLVTTVLYGVELVAALFAARTAIQAVDIPFINKSALFAPFDAATGVLARFR